MKEAIDSKFVTRKYNIANDQSDVNHGAGNGITYNTEVLKSNLCDYNNAYILVRGDIVTTARNIPTRVAFENCAPFNKCITKISGTAIDDVEDLDLVIQ